MSSDTFKLTKSSFYDNAVMSNIIYTINIGLKVQGFLLQKGVRWNLRNIDFNGILNRTGN